jgi:hypothetical protein
MRPLATGPNNLNNLLYPKPRLERAMDILFFLLPLALIAGEYFFLRSRKKSTQSEACGDCI